MKFAMDNISEAARHLHKLTEQAENIRKKIHAKASELGHLTQELFVIEHGIEVVVKAMQNHLTYDKKGNHPCN